MNNNTYPNIANSNEQGQKDANFNMDAHPKKNSNSSKSFGEIKRQFKQADVNEKIKIYTTTSGLSVEEFKELLRDFPLQHLEKLERAMEE